ncbi:1-(5-phosphoribosyl)-5-amino-4-imidazole-carboxylate carboxylase [Edaphobacter acidisoli]|uniref:1-(5-phosphoribosyl)-5-amino-4-imidazole-carboxylate carboxylase n=1 Tax=Edaphobacter acidisoli TaxID=2040573 RepID=A0A916RMJ2_9BACT|nr:nickel pincer cofactor biosynthesis protein LarB [Edaphobacter acidisoli]GGA59440.1 1-(5-phosphoribosyl)-5-amino-4-imidazole-carboxylate carboxylase [Edaphobacter acidisoli]
MTKASLLEILAQVQAGEISPQNATDRLATLPYEDIGHTRIDHHRALRTGLPEVIYAQGKSSAQTAEIFARMAAAGTDVLATRASEEIAEAVLAAVPAAVYHPQARAVTLKQSADKAREGHVAVVCAGTSDLTAAEEAAVTAELFHAQVTRLYDVGVAGLHRLLAVREQLADADVVIVCAGMEGALPSVVGGLVGVPVIAVPTSVGYGASFDGAAALLGMLNSCSPNVVVVNIDNGFGAAYTATMIARMAHRKRE